MSAPTATAAPDASSELARAEAHVQAHSESLKKELRVPDLVLTQILFIVGLTWIGVAGKLGPSHVVFWSLAILLFYLPSDESQAHLGTSLYVPKDAQFTCAGDVHHPFDRFERVAGMPFQPNSLFAFVKTTNSFHGVEPVIDANARRHLLLDDIQLKAVPKARESASGARFRF